MNDSEAHRPDRADDRKSTMAERLTGVRDPRDPDGLLTVEQDADRPDPTAFGHAETDTLEREQEHYARVRARDADGSGGDGDSAGRPKPPAPPHADGLTGLDSIP